MYEFYDGEEDPLLHEYEVSTREEAEYFNAVECSNGCGFWRGNLLHDGQCPDCGSDTNELDDHFE